MSGYIRKNPLEIPPPSEKDWIKKDEEENFFLQDPDQTFDSLPQPFRMINKLVTLVFEQAWEIIEKREALQEAQTLKVQPTSYLPTAEFQVMGRANCLAASGQHVFVGLSTGLAVFNMPTCKQVCVWESAKLEICAIRASNLGNETHLLITVDEMGRCPIIFIRSHLRRTLKTRLCTMRQGGKWHLFSTKDLKSRKEINKTKTFLRVSCKQWG
uniref:WD repeat domain 93 n=1 Tax=Pelodiscus sinensis TaxID=13735 RepID=K7G1J7_PELSI